MGTRKIGFLALEKAIGGRIKSNALTSGYTTYYNYIPDNATLPYIQIGGPIGTRSASLGACDIEGQDNLVTIHIWSDYKGETEVLGMMDNICQAVTGTALSITGYSNVLLLLDYTDVIRDDSNPIQIIFHGIVRFRCHMA